MKNQQQTNSHPIIEEMWKRLEDWASEQETKETR